MRKKSLADLGFELWDPLTAQCYYFENKVEDKRTFGCKFGKHQHLHVRLTDPICPLTQIHTVVSSENVYVNNQKVDYPIYMSFDFTKSKLWVPFYPKEETRVTIQTPIIYSLPQKNPVVIESRIQKYLVEMFQEERRKKIRKTTKWVVIANDELRDIILDCEKWA